MEPHSRHAAILMDEMQLTPGLDFDSSTASVIGAATVPPSKGPSSLSPATHALVFMLAGMSSRYKQPIAYHFTSTITSACFMPSKIDLQVRY